MKNTKQKKHIFSKDVYYLGKDKNGSNRWLEAPSWDCGWYWGFGYIETYTNNESPERSRDISEHTHFDSLFFSGNKCAFDTFKEFFISTPLSDDEIWTLCDYMMTFYTLKKTAELYRYGYSYQTERAKINIIKNKAQENAINEILLPELFKHIIAILTPESED